ncbi:MAG: glucosaminidase domain-containing protein [Candidatus Sumerlaeia bacterium]
MKKLNEGQVEFLEEVCGLAKKLATDYGLDWRLMAAAAILESGWGESVLARESRNYFGIRALPGDGKDKVYALKRGDGFERFRKYASMEESFRAYGRLLSRSRYYAAAREAREGVLTEPDVRDRLLEVFVAQMAPVYCPGDPDYGLKIMQLVEMVERVALVDGKAR